MVEIGMSQVINFLEVINGCKTKTEIESQGVRLGQYVKVVKAYEAVNK